MAHYTVHTPMISMSIHPSTHPSRTHAPNQSCTCPTQVGYPKWYASKPQVKTLDSRYTYILIWQISPNLFTLTSQVHSLSARTIVSLGVSIIDSGLTCNRHVNDIIHACHQHLLALTHISCPGFNMKTA